MTDIRSVDDYFAAIRKYIDDMQNKGHRLEATEAKELLRKEKHNLKSSRGEPATGYLGATVTCQESTYTYGCRNRWHNTVFVSPGWNEQVVTITTSDPALYSNSAKLTIGCSIDLLRQIVAMADEMAAKRKEKMDRSKLA